MVIDDPSQPKFNIFDVTKQCENPPLCYDFSYAYGFFNDPKVKQVLGVMDRTWNQCDTQVHERMIGDWCFDAKPYLAQLLDEFGVKVLIYYGEDDWVCNWRGGEAWTEEMRWNFQDQFLNAAYAPWSLNLTQVGLMRHFGNLFFLKVKNAGHRVPMDQPWIANEMLREFIWGGWGVGIDSN